VFRAAILFSAAIFAATLAATAQNAGSEVPATIAPRAKSNAPSAPSPKANIRVDTNLVLVPVNVTDPLSRFVTGLEESDFQIFEDGIRQKIVSFGNEDAPLSIGIVFDTSGSMGAKLSLSRLSVVEFFKTANPEDEAFLVEFSSRPELVVPFTHDLSEIQNRLLSTRPSGSTALLDGVTLAMQTMKKASNPRKAMIVITDGGDNHSRYTFSEVRNRVREADVQIYAVGIFGGGFGSAEEYYGPSLLSALSEPTGGHHFVAALNQLPDIASKIGVELRNQYLVGYTPANPARDGKYRSIKVTVLQPRGLPKLKAFWRRGYYSPTQ
jgi:Ca-activated chloride channel family protein